MRHVAQIPELLGPSFMKLVGYIQQQGGEILDAPFVAYKNMRQDGSIDEENLEMEVGFPVNKALESQDDIQCYTLPTYSALKTLYIGKYEDTTDTYLQMLDEIRSAGHAFLGMSYEYYLTDESVPLEKQETIIEIPYQ